MCSIDDDQENPDENNNTITSHQLEKCRKLDFEQTCVSCLKTFEVPMEFRCHAPCNGRFEKVYDSEEDQEKIKCWSCGDLCGSIEEMGLHMSMTHFSDNDFLFQCLLCNHRFIFESHFDNHYDKQHDHRREEWRFHDSNIRSTRSPDLSSVQSVQADTEYIQDVDITFYTQDLHFEATTNPSQEPERSNASLKQEVSLNDLGEDPLEVHLKNTEELEDKAGEEQDYYKLEYSRKCYNCQRIFTQPPAFRVHEPCFQFDEDSSGQVRCDVCGQVMTKEELPFHVSQVHWNKFDSCYVCMYCKERFFDRIDIGMHLFTEHKVTI